MLSLAATLALSAAITFPHGAAVISTAGGPSVRIRVEIAETPARRERGLSGRRALSPRSGMVFLWRSDVRGRFWMKNTSIPLSIAFLGKGGRILRILDMAPCLRDPCKAYDPGVRFRSALEVNRGALRRWHVGRGDVVTIRR